MPNNFELIMQLHGEGEPAPTPAAAPEGGAADAAESSAADTSVQTAEEPAGKRYAIEVDPRTQRRKIVSLADKQETPVQQQPAAEPQEVAEKPAEQQPVAEETPAQNVQPQEPAQPLFPQPQMQTNVEPYKTVAEVVDAIHSNTIDPRRVPIEYAGQVAQLRNAILAQMQQQAQPAKPVISQEQARNDFYMKVEQAARENALKAVGITEEELESADYTDDAGLKQRVKQFEAALAWQRNSIVEGVRQRQMQAMQQQQAQRQIYIDIDNAVNQYRQTEPEFEGINVLMAGLYKTMPYQQANKYAEAINAYQRGNITPEQAQALQEYYNEARKVYYAQKNGLTVVPAPTPAPPKVEQPGTGAQQPHHTTIADLRNAKNYKDARSIIGRMVAERQQRR